MPIRVKCEQCQKTLSVKDHLAGKKIKCPICQTVVTVPAASSAAPPAAPAPKPAAPKVAGPAAKPGVLAKPAVAKPATDKSKTNGTPSPRDQSKSNGTPPPADKAKSNGVPAPPPPPKPAPVELPPENVEAEALAAFADEPKPVEDTTPKTIDFKCEWCDEDLHLPLDLGGKQTQCPNKECRRIIKVPLPKIEGPKDWRKMDRRGPAAALVSQPEQLDDAWGTQDATRARQDSLAQAGAVAEAPKPKRDATAWLTLGFWVVLGCAAVVLLYVGGGKLYSTKKQHNAIGELEKLVDNRNPQINNPLLLAEAYRTLGLLYLREVKGAEKSQKNFRAALSMVDFKPEKKDEAINEQLFLIDLALAQIELGGSEDEVIGKTRLPWGDIQKNIQTTLEKIVAPEAQEIAMRAVASRLIEKKQPDVALGLAGSLSRPGQVPRPPVFSQLIALQFSSDQKPDAEMPAANAKEELKNAPVRSGYAEGHARKGDFDAAMSMVEIKGPPKDQLEASLGVAAVALTTGKDDQAARFVDKALEILAAKKPTDVSDWTRLQLVKLGARTGKADAVKNIADSLPPGPFKTRAQLELFLAACDKSTSRLDAAPLADLETDDADKEKTTLALAWHALARQNARLGAGRRDNQKTLQTRLDIWADKPPDIAAILQPMIDVGTYLGSLK